MENRSNRAVLLNFQFIGCCLLAIALANPVFADDGLIRNQGKKMGISGASTPAAHVFGLGLSSTGYIYDSFGKPFANGDLESDKGYHGFNLSYHLIKPEAGIYFSPTIIYDYVSKDEKNAQHDLTNHHRFLHFAANIGFNLDHIIAATLPVQPFLEAGAGIFIIQSGQKGSYTYGYSFSYDNSGSSWSFLPVGFNLMAGARYWFKDHLGVEGSLRYINCFFNPGLNTGDYDQKITFQDINFGFGLIWKP